MKYVILLALLLFGCGDEALTPTDNSDWDCADNLTDFHRAFVQCVTSMGITTQRPYTAGECEDYAHRNFCVSRKAKENAKLKQAQAEIKLLSTELSKTKKLVKKYDQQRLALCATLEGTCLMYQEESKKDQSCDIACTIGDEDLLPLVDKMIEEKRKKAEKE
jgi:hypothetical protein